MAAVDCIKSALNDQFKLKDLGPAKYFLGMKISRSKRGNSHLSNEICFRTFI